MGLPYSCRVEGPAEVARAFPVGGLIRLYSRGKKHHIARLTSPPLFGATTITFNFAPRLGDCTTGDMEDGWIAPLQVIRYGVTMSDPNSLDSDRVTGAAFAQLTRMRMEPRLMTTVLESRPVLDYTATFNLASMAVSRSTLIVVRLETSANDRPKR